MNFEDKLQEAFEEGYYQGMNESRSGIGAFHNKFMNTGKKNNAYNTKKRQEFERELKKAGVKFVFVAANREGPVEDTYYVSVKNYSKAQKILNKFIAGALFDSEALQFLVVPVSKRTKNEL